MLKQQLTGYGSPIIFVKDGNYNDNRELYLVHVTDPQHPIELYPEYERGTLEKIFHLWERTVHLETHEIVEQKENGSTSTDRVLDSYDGKHHVSTKLGNSAIAV